MEFDNFDADYSCPTSKKKGTTKELSQFDNKKPEELESEFDNFDAKISYPTSKTKRTIKELSQFDNKKPEELELEFDNFDADCLYLTSPFKCRNIVDLDLVRNQLLDGHKACKTILSLMQYQRERFIGLASILHLSLQNCSTVTMVKTSIYDVSTKCGADMFMKFLLRYCLRVSIMLCSSVFE